MNNQFEVIVIGGSYAGLSAAMALGRALRRTLVIDSGKPCNRYTPHSHNFITQDGVRPSQIGESAKEQVKKYDTVHFFEGLAVKAERTASGFEIFTSDDRNFASKKLVLATGLRDIMPDIKGFEDCWGTSVIHCPYCHGYEYRFQKTGIMANGEKGFHYAKLISQWTRELILFTNGKAEFTAEQLEKIDEHGIPIVEAKIKSFNHEKGNLKSVSLEDGTTHLLKAVYTSPPFEQHSAIPLNLNCEMTESGLMKVDPLQRTSVKGVFACGDNSGMRAVSAAVASGTMAGAAVNMELIEEAF